MSIPVNEIANREKISLQDPRAGEEPDSGLRTMGVDHVDAS
jgi:hypothetical protein